MEKLIATIPRNSRDEIRIELGEYKGHEFVSVRIWTKSHDSEDVVPTKKGITVKPDQLAELITALKDAEKVVIEAGLLTAEA